MRKGQVERARCLTKDRVVRFHPNKIPEHPFLSRQFLYIWHYHAFQWANSTPAAYTLTHKNCPLGAQLRLPRNFLALKVVGKAQECDLSAIGQPTVDKPFRWLISCTVSGCFEAPSVCTLALLAVSSPTHADGRCFSIDTYVCGFC